MVVELDGHIMRCVRDQNGNHVIQKCIECIHEDATKFIISTFYDQGVTLSTHQYGCRLFQKVLQHCQGETTQQIVMDEIMQSVCILAKDQYAKSVVQFLRSSMLFARVCFPMAKGMYRVLNISEDEAVLLHSREKAPYLIRVEVLRCETPSYAKDTSNTNKLSRAGIPLANGDALLPKPPTDATRGVL